MSTNDKTLNSHLAAPADEAAAATNQGFEKSFLSRAAILLADGVTFEAAIAAAFQQEEKLILDLKAARTSRHRAVRIALCHTVYTGVRRHDEERDFRGRLEEAIWS
jgi:hypothetical protein